MKPHIFIFLLFTFIPPFITAQIPDSLKYTVLGPEEFINEFNSGSKAVLIDVRTFKDYRKSRIKGAVNIEHPIPEDYFTRSDSITRDKSLFIYCYGGFRSKKAAVAFYDHGYRNIYSLEGGFMKWKSKKMPTDKKKIK